MKKKLLILISFSISILFILNFTKIFDLNILKNYLDKLGLLSFIGCMLLYLSSFLLRALRWNFLISNEYKVPFKDLYKVNILGYAANNILPLRLGEIVRAQILYKFYSISRSFSIGTIFIERVFDLITILVFLIIGYFINFGNLDILIKFSNLIIFGMIFILFFSLFIYKFKVFTKLSLTINRFKYFSYLNNFFKSFKSLSCFLVLKIFFLSLLIWIVEIFVLQTLLLLLDIPKSFATSIFTVPILNLGLLIPSAPGYLGVFQSGFVFAFEKLNIEVGLGLSISIIFHFIQYFPVTILGIYFFYKYKINLVTFLSKKINE